MSEGIPAANNPCKYEPSPAQAKANGGETRDDAEKVEAYRINYSETTPPILGFMDDTAFASDNRKDLITQVERTSRFFHLHDVHLNYKKNPIQHQQAKGRQTPSGTITRAVGSDHRQGGQQGKQVPGNLL